MKKVKWSRPVTIDIAWYIVKLTGTEYKLLAYLAANYGRVLTHQSIPIHVWGPEDADHTEYLRVYIRQLRPGVNISRR